MRSLTVSVKWKPPGGVNVDWNKILQQTTKRVTLPAIVSQIAGGRTASGAQLPLGRTYDSLRKSPLVRTGRLLKSLNVWVRRARARDFTGKTIARWKWIAIEPSTTRVYPATGTGQRRGQGRHRGTNRTTYKVYAIQAASTGGTGLVQRSREHRVGRYGSVSKGLRRYDLNHGLGVDMLDRLSPGMEHTLRRELRRTLQKSADKDGWILSGESEI